MKICKGCGTQVPPEEAQTGRCLICHRANRAAYMRAWKEKNREKANEQRRARRAANPEQAQQQLQRWHQENPGKHSEYNRRKAAADPEKLRRQKRESYQRSKARRDALKPPPSPDKTCSECGSLNPTCGFNTLKVKGKDYALTYCRDCYNKRHGPRQKAWQNSNRDKVQRYHRANRAARLKSEGSFTAAEFKELCERHGNICLCCKQAKKLTPDHVVPVSKGGSSFIENIQPLCMDCNRRKSARSTDYRPPG